MPYIGSSPNFGAVESQTITTANGSTAAFTLNQFVPDSDSIIVTVGNVVQEPTTAYSAVGTTITFTENVPNGDTIVIRYLGRSVDVPTTYTNINRFKFVATSGQDTFQNNDANGLTLSYTAGNIDVFMNGVRLDEADFTASNGTSVVLGTNASASDEIVIIAYKSVVISNGLDKSSGGTVSGTTVFSGQTTFSGQAYFSGGIFGDVSFDSGTLKIDAGNNRVGINTSSPDAKLDVEGTTDAEIRITRTTASASSTFNDQGSVLHLFNDVEFENGYNGGASVGQIIFSSDDGSTGQGIRAKIACTKLGYSHSESLAFYVSPGNTTSGQCTATSNTLGKVLEIAFNKNMYHRATRLDAEHADFANVHIGDKSSFGSFAAGSTYVVNNAYYNTGSSWVKKVTGASNLINMTTTGDWYFQYSASASAGANTSFTNRYLLNDNGGGIYLYSDGHGNGAITMYNNNIYLASNSGSGEVYATDAAGNHSLLSPHNFKYIPEGKSADNAWSYLSEKVTPTTRKDANDNDEFDTDRKDGDSFTYVNVDMMKVVREVEKLTGTKLIYTGTDGKDDGSTVKDDIIAGLIKRIETLEAKVKALEEA
jgi:hypothetical protein